MIRPGEEWGTPATGEPAIDVHGDDRALARAVADHPGALFRFRPDPASDLARAVGLTDRPSATELPLDALAYDGGLAVNMIVAGRAPDRLRWSDRMTDTVVVVDGREVFSAKATTIVVATGEFLRGNDVVPRGHPGDGRAEVQVYAVAGRERAQLRDRVRTGAHVPHPAIVQRSGRTIEVVRFGTRGAEVDGERTPQPMEGITIEVVPNAYRLLV